MTMLPNIEEAMEDARNGKLSPYWQNNLKRECLHVNDLDARTEANGTFTAMNGKQSIRFWILRR